MLDAKPVLLRDYNMFTRSYQPQCKPEGSMRPFGF
jgi:hypothetical protein